MNKLYLADCISMLDINKILDYNNEFKAVYGDEWKPFVTEENFEEYLKQIERIREGMNDGGIKEIFYWFFEEDKIIGSGSIRLNLEENEKWEKYYGNIFYQVIPSKRKSGYGTQLCRLLLQEMYDMGYENAVITCNETNIGSSKIIENNGGKLIEIVSGDGEDACARTKRYKIDLGSHYNK